MADIIRLERAKGMVAAMGNKKFRIGLFGFRKSDVCGYIQDMNSEFADRLQQKEDACSKLQKDLANCRLQLAELQKEKDKVAGALIIAEDKAKDIVSAAEQSAENKRAEIEKEYKIEKEKLRAIKDEVVSIRDAALTAIKRFEEKMSALENSIGKTEENAGPSSAASDGKPAPTATDAPKTSAAPKTPVIPSENNSKINIIKLS